jgi:hypothetical protein
MECSNKTRELGLATRALYFFVAPTLVSLLLGCGGSEVSAPDESNINAVLGDFVLTDLTFDPMGSLPAMDLRARLKVQAPPQLTIAAAGEAQLWFRSSETGLNRIAEGRWRLTASGLNVTLTDPNVVASVALPGILDLTFVPATQQLTFSGPVTGMRRADLVALVPEWAGEQLLDPTPGDLILAFGRAP